MWTKVKPLMQFYTQVHVLNSPYGVVIKQNFRDEFVDVLHFPSSKSKTRIFSCYNFAKQIKILFV